MYHTAVVIVSWHAWKRRFAAFHFADTKSQNQRGSVLENSFPSGEIAFFDHSAVFVKCYFADVKGTQSSRGCSTIYSSIHALNIRSIEIIFNIIKKNSSNPLIQY